MHVRARTLYLRSRPGKMINISCDYESLRLYLDLNTHAQLRNWGEGRVTHVVREHIICPFS